MGIVVSFRGGRQATNQVAQEAQRQAGQTSEAALPPLVQAPYNLQLRGR